MGRKLLILNERDLLHPNAGGAELHISETAKRFVERGYSPTLLCSSFAGAAAVDVCDGMQVRRFGNRFTYYAALPRAVHHQLRTPGTVIIEHFNKLPFCTPLYTRAPVLVLAHHLFGRTAFQQVRLPIAAVTYGVELLIPSVYRHKHFIAVSPSTRDDLVQRGVAASRIQVIPNGLDHALYHARGRLPSEMPTLLFVGRVEFYKRVDLIISALQRVRAEIPRVHLVIVGDGQARPRLQQQVSALGLSQHVSFTGFVSDAEKVEHIRRAHIVVNTSEKEGWGLTVLEANACGLPAIASDVAGLRDAVRDGETGVLVPHGDIAALSAAMLRLLNDAGERERLAAGALAWAQQFSWQQSADDILRVVEEVAATG